MQPFKCPHCNFDGKDVKLQVRHYGIKHHVVVRMLNERAGRGPNCYDQSVLKQHETSEGQRESCPLCGSADRALRFNLDGFRIVRCDDCTFQYVLDKEFERQTDSAKIEIINDVTWQ